MSIIFGNDDNELVSFYYNKETVKTISKIKYGNYKLLMNMPFIRECSIFDSRLIKHDEITKLNFTGKVPDNTCRSESIFQLEEDVIREYGSYILLRLDIRLPSNSEDIITNTDYTGFIGYVRNTIRHNEVYGIIGGWCYGIEGIGEDTHIHWYIFLRGDRYIYLNKRDRELQYKRDVGNLTRVILNYISYQNGVISNCILNIADMSDTKDRIKVILVTSDDIYLRNCSRGWLCYICKNKKDGSDSKSYGKSLVKNTKMTNELLEWVKVLPRLLESSDSLAMSRINKEINYVESRLEVMYSVEDEICKKYDRYMMLSFRVSSDYSSINPSDFGDYLKKFNTYKYTVPILNRSYICYCWSINLLSDRIEFYFNVFINPDKLEKNIDYFVNKIIYYIEKWYSTMDNSLVNSKMIIPSVDSDDIISRDDYKKRNMIRYDMVVMALADSTEIDYDPRYLRSFAVSKIRDNT